MKAVQLREGSSSPWKEQQEHQYHTAQPVNSQKSEIDYFSFTFSKVACAEHSQPQDDVITQTEYILQ